MEPAETRPVIQPVVQETAVAAESPRLEPRPLTVIPMTPPVEATLRILLNSVPYLIGAAVVRHPAVGDAVQAEVGRMPWLHDRRLLNLQLPDDTLPANRAVVLDWPVPYQAEPEPQPLVVEPVSEVELDPKDEQDERDRMVVEEVARALDELTDARSIGRVLRDAVSAIAGVDGFSVALFNSVRREVAYRYKVVGGDPAAPEMGRQAIDDGPDCYAARRDRRWHTFVREIGVRGSEGVDARKISVLQYPLVSADEIYGVATLQAFGETGYSDHATRLVARVLEVASDRLAAVRRTGRFQPSLSPQESAAAAVLPPVAAAPSSLKNEPEPPTTDEILGDLLTQCAGIGLPTTFLVGVDPAAGLLRGELISGSSAARELDYALGITVCSFTIELADRYNAIARACREGRVVSAMSLDEIVTPLRDADGAATLERLVQGGRSMILPITVSGDVVGALVVGPMADEPGFSTVESVRDLVNETASRLTEAWRTNR